MTIDELGNQIYSQSMRSNQYLIIIFWENHSIFWVHRSPSFQIDRLKIDPLIWICRFLEFLGYWTPIETWSPQISALICYARSKAFSDMIFFLFIQTPLFCLRLLFLTTSFLLSHYWFSISFKAFSFFIHSFSLTNVLSSNNYLLVSELQDFYLRFCLRVPLFSSWALCFL